MRIQGPRDFEKADQKPQVGARPAKSEETSAPSQEKAAVTASATVVVSEQASKATRASEASEKKFADRVAELKAMVEAGTYQVDRQLLADRIVAEECVK